MTTNVNALNAGSSYSGYTDYFGTTGTSNYNYNNIWGYSTDALQNQYNYNNTYNSYNNKNTAQSLAIQDQCTSIATVISNGQEDEVLSEFNELVQTLKSQDQYANCTDTELKALARNMFQNITGTSLTDAINENCSGSFATGFNVINPFDNDVTSKEDLISEVTGTKKKAGSEIAEAAGGITGGAAAGAATGAAIGSFICFGPGTAIGAGIGAAVGAIGGFIKGLF